mgnify:CR=1 FL=1
MSVETKQLNCINCPLGCLLTVTLEDGKLPALPAIRARAVKICPSGTDGPAAHADLDGPPSKAANCRSCRSYPRRPLPKGNDPRLCRSIAQRRSQSPGPYRRRHRQRYPGSRRRYRGQPRYGQRIIGTNIFPLTYTEKEAALYAASFSSL